ncbi:hypothetical protein AN1V17_39560 [Vallitalea sediminicola]
MIEREEIFMKLVEIIEMENDEDKLTTDTYIEDIVFDSITKIGVMALIDTYATKKVNVQDLLDCKQIKNIIDLVH